MALSSATVRVDYSGNGSTTSFAVTFVFWDDSDITVVHRTAAGVETTWVDGTQYTLSGGDGSTGTLTVDTSPTDYTPASGETLTIRGNRALPQPTTYPLGGSFPSTAVEQAEDQIVRLVQQRSEEIDRCLKFPVTDSTSLSTTLPTSVSRLDKFLVFNESTGATEASENTVTQLAGLVASTTLISTSAQLATALSDETGTAGSAVFSVSPTLTGTISINGDTTFNDSGADVNFRVESDNQQHALYVNGGLDNVGVGYSAEPLITSKGITILSGDQTGGLVIVKEDGSLPSSGEGLGTIGFRGEDSANTLAAASGSISSYATVNHSGSAAGADLRFYTKAVGVGPGSAPAERMRMDSVGNISIAGTAVRGSTVGAGALHIFNGTAPAGTLTNGISLFSDSGELKVLDASGNSTTLSPHDNETNEWIFDSVQTVTGKHLRIDVEKILRFINDKYGLEAILDETIGG